MSIIQNNAKIVSACNQRLTALKKYVKTTKTAMSVGGEQMKLADLIGVYQAAIDTRSALVPVRAQYQTALEARNDAETTRQATDKKLKAWVVNELGADSEAAREFGFAPPTVREKSAATKALAVLKMRATRKARGTMGKRQKEQIKGTVVVPAAPAAPATTTPAAAPAADVTTSTNVAPTSAAPSSSGVTGSH